MEKNDKKQIKGRKIRRSFNKFERTNQYKEKMIDIRRVARVVKGGKRFSFRVTIVIGDENGKVGVGIGKGLDVSIAMDKARNNAKKSLVNIPIKGTTIPHEVFAKYSAAKVILKPAKKGSGLKSGGSVRTVLLMAGIKDATSKCIGRTKNKLTNALATIKALNQLNSNFIKKDSFDNNK